MLIRSGSAMCVETYLPQKRGVAVVVVAVHSVSCAFPNQHLDSGQWRGLVLQNADCIDRSDCWIVLIRVTSRRECRCISSCTAPMDTESGAWTL
jgi:hypothetical protein